MRIAIGADHAGFQLKRHLLQHSSTWGHEFIDVGSYDEAPVDYPDVAEDVGRTVTGGDAERGVLICGSGVGASIAANKLPGIRAGLCHDVYSARQGVEHDDMNVLTLGSRVIGTALAEELLSAFLGAKFTGEQRHLRRVEKVGELERRCLMNTNESE